MKQRKIVRSTVIALAGILMTCGPSMAMEAGAKDGTAKGETSDVQGQQGVGLGSGSGSSNVIMGGPEPIIGKISGIQGERYSILLFCSVS